MRPAQEMYSVSHLYNSPGSHDILFPTPRQTRRIETSHHFSAFQVKKKDDALQKKQQKTSTTMYQKNQQQ
jgi:hypothetical protein